MSGDPRLKIVLGIAVQSVLLCRTLTASAAALAVVILAAVLTGSTTRRVALYWCTGEAILFAIFALAIAFESGSIDYNTMAFLRWTAGFTGGVVVVLWTGVEDLARVVIRLPIPQAMSRALGFALRVLPILASNAGAHRRNVRMIRLVRGTAPGSRGTILRIGLEEVLTQCVDDIDKVVTQLELRGYHVSLFGRLPPFEYSAPNVVMLSGSIIAAGVPIIERLALMSN